MVDSWCDNFKGTWRKVENLYDLSVVIDPFACYFFREWILFNSAMFQCTYSAGCDLCPMLISVREKILIDN